MRHIHSIRARIYSKSFPRYHVLVFRNSPSSFVLSFSLESLSIASSAIQCTAVIEAPKPADEIREIDKTHAHGLYKCKMNLSTNVPLFTHVSRNNRLQV